MSYLKINVEEEDKEFVGQLLQKLGFEVIEESDGKPSPKKTSKVSPTMLFGEWKDIELDPTNYRKQLWAPKK